jgi:hypothetical protein
LIATEQKHIQAMKTLAQVQQAAGHQGDKVQWMGRENTSYLAALESVDNDSFFNTCFLLRFGQAFDSNGKTAILLYVGDAIDNGDAA